MALIVCPECHNQMSSDAKNCPHCGHKNELLKQRNKKRFIVVFIVLLVVVGLGMAFGLFQYNRSLDEAERENEISSLTLSLNEAIDENDYIAASEYLNQLKELDVQSIETVLGDYSTTEAVVENCKQWQENHEKLLPYLYNCMELLKDNLLNPQSLVIKQAGLTYRFLENGTDFVSCVFYIDYSAENRVGGVSNQKAYIGYFLGELQQIDMDTNYYVDVSPVAEKSVNSFQSDGLGNLFYYSESYSDIFADTEYTGSTIIPQNFYAKYVS